MNIFTYLLKWILSTWFCKLIGSELLNWQIGHSSSDIELKLSDGAKNLHGLTSNKRLIWVTLYFNLHPFLHRWNTQGQSSSWRWSVGTSRHRAFQTLLDCSTWWGCRRWHARRRNATIALAWLKIKKT